MKTNWVAPKAGATPVELLLLLDEIIETFPNCRAALDAEKRIDLIPHKIRSSHTNLAITPTGTPCPYDAERILNCDLT